MDKRLKNNVAVVTGAAKGIGLAIAERLAKDGVTDTYFGSNRYRLVAENGRLRIKEKRCLLDTEGLRTQGRVSIIL